MPAHRDPLVFVDADDTLWENNRYFNAVLDRFADFMAGAGVPRDRALAALHAEEDRNIPVHGYGAAPFVHSLRRTFSAELPDATPTLRREFEDLATSAETTIRDHPIDLLPGVADGLTRLAARARLVVLTKGQHDEQTAKVERSGLGVHFRAVRVVAEKDDDTYLAAARAWDASPRDCWMVGNSPRSDVNPARRAGLRTVHVPHAAPWHREQEPLVTTGPPTLVASSFADVPPLILGDSRIPRPPSPRA